MDKKKTVVEMIIVLFAGIVSWIIFIQGPVNGDGASLMQVAQSLDYWIKHMTLGSPFNTHYSYRVGVIMPLMILQHILPFKLLAFYVFAFGAFLLCYFSVYLISKKLTNKTVAYLSCLLFLSSFFCTDYSSKVMSDHISAGFALLSFYLFLRSFEQKKYVKTIIIISACVGFYSYFCKISSILFFVCIPAYELLAEKRLKKTILFVLIFVALITGESVLHWIVSNNPFARYITVFGILNLNQNVPASTSISDFLLRFPKYLIFSKTGKILLCLGTVGFVLSIYKRLVGVISIFAGAIFVTIFHAYSVSSFIPLIPATNTMDTRFYLLLFSCLVMSSSYLIYYSIHMVMKKHKTVEILLVVVISIVISSFQYQEQFRYRYGKILFGYKDRYLNAGISFSKFLNEHEELKGSTIYCMPARTFRIYPYFDKLIYHDAEQEGIMPAPCFVLVDRTAVLAYRNYFTRFNMISLADTFMPMIRKGPNYKILYEADEMVLAKVDRWENDKIEILNIFNNKKSKYYFTPDSSTSIVADKTSDYIKINVYEKIENSVSLIEIEREEINTGLIPDVVLSGETIRIEVGCKYNNIEKALIHIRQVSGEKTLDAVDLSVVQPGEPNAFPDKKKTFYEIAIKPGFEKIRLDIILSSSNDNAFFLIDELNLYRFDD